jgi:hypothetical protein
VADRRKTAAEVRVLAVELNRRVEAADALDRVAADGEVAAVQNGTPPENPLGQNVVAGARL